MKRIILLFTVIGMAAGLWAQPHPKFDPELFEAELEQYISTEAGLSPQDAASFFPVYKEMQAKIRTLFFKKRKYHHINTSDNAASLEAIKQQDAIDIQIKKVQQAYHLKFCKILPAGKVLQVIKAEERFRRLAFRRLAKKR